VNLLVVGVGWLDEHAAASSTVAAAVAAAAPARHVDRVLMRTTCRFRPEGRAKTDIIMIDP
jgi:hypothetical protein